MQAQKSKPEDLSVYQIGGQLQKAYDTMDAYKVGTTKGGGSAYGGQWQPHKPEDKRFLGEPGEIKQTYDRKGNQIETKIGPDGRATHERHHSNHGNPSKHSVPHDHKIEWSGNRPTWASTKNYWDGIIPQFKLFRRDSMTHDNFPLLNSLEENRFKTISEFKWCMQDGGEVEIEWNGIHYAIIPYGIEKKIYICLYNQPETEQCFDTADDALEYMLGEDRLRDVITKVTVWNRTI